MTTDPRIEAAARAIHFAEFGDCWGTEVDRDTYRATATAAVAAIDKAATITTGEQLASLPEGAVIRFMDIMPQVAEKDDEGTWISVGGIKYQYWDDRSPTPVPFPAQLLFGGTE